MNRYFLLAAIGVITLAGACTKSSNHKALAVADVTGTWQLKEVNSNAYWGGPFSWKTIDEDVVVRFTAQGNYYRKPAGQPDYILEGTYEIVDGQRLKIITSVPQNGQKVEYTIGYTTDGEWLVLGTGRTETIIEEKFKRL